MVVTGLVIGNYTMPRIVKKERGQFETFWQAVDEGLNSSLFVLMGLHIALVPMLHTWVPTALCAIAVCLRGGLALAMALSLPASPEKDLILHITYGVVAFSIVVQGLSIARNFKADALERLLPDDKAGSV